MYRYPGYYVAQPNVAAPTSHHKNGKTFREKVKSLFCKRGKQQRWWTSPHTPNNAVCPLQVIQQQPIQNFYHNSSQNVFVQYYPQMIPVYLQQPVILPEPSAPRLSEIERHFWEQMYFVNKLS